MFIRLSKKTLLILLISMLTVPVWNQSTEKRISAYRTTLDTIIEINTAGDELQIAVEHFYLGSGSILVGTGLIVGSYYFPEEMSREGSFEVFMFGVGSILAVAGTVLTFESFSHIRKAGLLLNEYGIGFKVPIK